MNESFFQLYKILDPFDIEFFTQDKVYEPYIFEEGFFTSVRYEEEYLDFTYEYVIPFRMMAIEEPPDFDTQPLNELIYLRDVDYDEMREDRKKSVLLRESRYKYIRPNFDWLQRFYNLQSDQITVNIWTYKDEVPYAGGLGDIDYYAQSLIDTEETIHEHRQDPTFLVQTQYEDMERPWNSEEIKVGKAGYLDFDYVVQGHKIKRSANGVSNEILNDTNDYCLVSTDDRLIKISIERDTLKKEYVMTTSYMNEVGRPNSTSSDLAGYGQFTYLSEIRGLPISKESNSRASRNLGPAESLTNSSLFPLFYFHDSGDGKNRVNANIKVLEKISPTAYFDKRDRSLTVAITTSIPAKDTVSIILLKSFDSGSTWERVSEYDTEMPSDVPGDFLNYINENYDQESTSRGFYIESVDEVQSRTRIAADPRNMDRLILVYANKYQVKYRIDDQEKIHYHRYMGSAVSKDGGRTWISNTSPQRVAGSTFENVVNRIAAKGNGNSNLFDLFDSPDRQHFYHDFVTQKGSLSAFDFKTAASVDPKRYNTPYFALYYDEDLENFVIMKGVQRAELYNVVGGITDIDDFQDKNGGIPLLDSTLYGPCFNRSVDFQSNPLLVNYSNRYNRSNLIVQRSYLKAIVPEDDLASRWRVELDYQLNLNPFGARKDTRGKTLIDDTNILSIDDPKTDRFKSGQAFSYIHSYNVSSANKFLKSASEYTYRRPLWGFSRAGRVEVATMLTNQMNVTLGAAMSPPIFDENFDTIGDYSFGLFYIETEDSSFYNLADLDVVSLPGKPNYLVAQVFSRMTDLRLPQVNDTEAIDYNSLPEPWNRYNIGEYFMNLLLPSYNRTVKVIRDTAIIPFKFYDPKNFSTNSENDFKTDESSIYKVISNEKAFLVGSFDLRRQSLLPNSGKSHYSGHWVYDGNRTNAAYTLYDGGAENAQYKVWDAVNAIEHPVAVTHKDEIVVSVDITSLSTKDDFDNGLRPRTSLLCISNRWSNIFDESPYTDVFIGGMAPFYEYNGDDKGIPDTNAHSRYLPSHWRLYGPSNQLTVGTIESLTGSARFRAVNPNDFKGVGPLTTQPLSKNNVRTLSFFTAHDDTTGCGMIKYGDNIPTGISLNDHYIGYGRDINYTFEEDPYTGFFKADFTVSSPDSTGVFPESFSFDMVEFVAVKNTLSNSGSFAKNSALRSTPLGKFYKLNSLGSTQEGNYVGYGIKDNERTTNERIFRHLYKLEKVQYKVTIQKLATDPNGLFRVVVYKWNFNTSLYDETFSSTIDFSDIDNPELTDYYRGGGRALRPVNFKLFCHVDGNISLWYKLPENYYKGWIKIGSEPVSNKRTEYVTFPAASDTELTVSDGALTADVFLPVAKMRSGALSLTPASNVQGGATTPEVSLVPLVKVGIRTTQQSQHSDVIPATQTGTYGIRYLIFKHSFGQFGGGQESDDSTFSPEYVFRSFYFPGGVAVPDAQRITKLPIVTSKDSSVSSRSKWLSKRLQYEGLDVDGLVARNASPAILGRSMAQGIVFPNNFRRRRSENIIPIVINLDGVVQTDRNVITISKNNYDPKNSIYTSLPQTRKDNFFLGNSIQNSYKVSYYNSRDEHVERVYIRNCFLPSYECVVNYHDGTSSNFQIDYEEYDIVTVGVNHFEVDGDISSALGNIICVYDPSNDFLAVIDDVLSLKNNKLFYLKNYEIPALVGTSKIRVYPRNFYVDLSTTGEPIEKTVKSFEFIVKTNTYTIDPLHGENIGDVYFASKLRLGDFIENVVIKHLEPEINENDTGIPFVDGGKANYIEIEVDGFLPYNKRTYANSLVQNYLENISKGSMIVLHAYEPNVDTFYLTTPQFGAQRQVPISLSEDGFKLNLRNT